MNVTEDLENLERAIKWQQASNVAAVIESARARIEKLENDVKVLRWALWRAKEVFQQTGNFPVIVSLLETAESMTEPANDR